MQVATNESPSAQSHGDRGDDESPPSAKRRKKGHSMEALLAREVGLMRDGAGNTSASFVGSASGIHFIRSVYGAIGSPEADRTSPDANLVPGEDDRLASGTSSGGHKLIWNASEVQPLGSDSSSDQISFDDLVEWTASYFDNWHPAFPLLHAPTILAMFESMVKNDASRHIAWEKTIIKAIVSLSLADQRQSYRPVSKSVPRSLVFSSFDDALLEIQPALTRPATITGLQAVACVQLFLVSMLRLNAASRLGGLIVQMAFQLGLHRCPMRYQSFSSEDQQLRKRLFWSIYCIERYICQALGLPLTIRDADVDVCHLNKEQHHFPTQKRPGPTVMNGTAAQNSSEPFDRRLQLLVFLAEHAQLRGSIIELRNKRVEERDKSPDTAVFINARLISWWNEVEDFLDQQEFDDTSTSSLHKVILESLKHESVIMLNRPLLALPKSTASYAGAIHACIGAAKSLLTTLHSLVHRTPSNNQPIPHVPMMWPSFTWATWMSAFIVLYGAAEGKVTTQVASRNVDKSLKILEQLAKRGSVWPEACAVAIEDLRSILTHHKGPATTPTPLSGNSNDYSNPTQVRPQPSAHAPIGERPYFDRTSNSNAIVAQVSPNSDVPHMQHSSSRGPVSSFGAYSAPAPDENGGASGIHEMRPSNSRQGTEAFHNMQDSLLTDFTTSQTWANPSFLTKNVQPLAFGGLDPFQGFDIPFWFGQDNYVAYMGSNP